MHSLFDKNYLVATLSLSAEELKLNGVGFVGFHILRIFLEVFNSLGTKSQ